MRKLILFLAVAGTVSAHGTPTVISSLPNANAATICTSLALKYQTLNTDSQLVDDQQKRVNAMDPSSPAYTGALKDLNLLKGMQAQDQKDIDSRANYEMDTVKIDLDRAYQIPREDLAVAGGRYKFYPGIDDGPVVTVGPGQILLTLYGGAYCMPFNDAGGSDSAAINRIVRSLFAIQS